MVENSLLLFAISVAAIYIFIHGLTYLQDVPELYLQEQSVIEPTRLINESPVYHSNKLSGLRVGLDIRYDSYKSRNGNLNDIWEILIRFSKEFDKGILVNNEKISVSYINYCIDQIDMSRYKTILIPKTIKSMLNGSLQYYLGLSNN